MDQQQIKTIGCQQLQRLFGTGNNMGAVSDVMTQRVFLFRRRSNTAFGNNLHFFTQVRRQFHRLAKRRLTLVSAINIRMIDCRDTEIEMLLNKAD